MKKLIFITILVIFQLSLKAQQAAVYIDTIRIDAGTVIANDTIVAFPYEQVPSHISIGITYTTLNQDDATIDIVTANRRGHWKTIGISGFPFTMDATENTDTLTNEATVTVSGTIMPYPLWGLRYKQGTVTDGEIRATRIMIVPVKRSGVLP